MTIRIEIVQGDITQQPDVDAIINAANTDLALGAGVAGAIRRRGGEEIDREARAHGPIHLGQAVATTAGLLPNRYVIHAAAMGYRPEDDLVPKRKGSLSSRAIIADATNNSLQCADQLGLTSIAFPALATGVAGFPVNECAEAMIEGVRKYDRDHPDSYLRRVRFVLYDEPDCRAFKMALQRLS